MAHDGPRNAARGAAKPTVFARLMSPSGLGRVKTLRWAGRNLGMLVTCEGFSALTMP
jgi:hypothetical protein